MNNCTEYLILNMNGNYKKYIKNWTDNQLEAVKEKLLKLIE